MIAFVKEISERLSKGDISKHLNQGFALNCFILSYLVSYNFISICLQRTRLSLIFCIHDFFKIFLFSVSIWLCLAYKRWAMAQRTDQRINQAFRPIISRAILFSCHHVIIHTLWMCLLALWRTLLLPPSAFVFYLLSFFHSVRREPDSRALVRSSI